MGYIVALSAWENKIVAVTEGLLPLLVDLRSDKCKRKGWP
jgi:hypothetical protein